MRRHPGRPLQRLEQVLADSVYGTFDWWLELVERVGAPHGERIAGLLSFLARIVGTGGQVVLHAR